MTTDTDILGIRALGKRRSEIERKRQAEKALAAIPFIPEPPFRVETLSGGAITNDGRESWITDVHVVDARGRTVLRMPHKRGDGLSSRRQRAAWYAAEMSELLKGDAAA